VQVDGNDVIVVRQVLEEALDRARRGGGPTVVEALSYRLADHTTSDDASRYRSSAEVEAAWQREPIARLRQFLWGRGLWDAAAEERLKREQNEAIEAAVKQYLATPKQSTDSIFEHVLAEMPPGLRAQRDEARRYASAHG
jgi:pyruvate dehydrogenase E1 component alpha subunit